MSLNTRILELENQVRELTNKIKDLSFSIEEKTTNPYTKVGGTKNIQVSSAVDIKTGLGHMKGGGIIWNDSELFTPALNQSLEAPTKGFNKHSHSKFSGGALIKDVLEIVDYDWTSIISPISNKDSQQYWPEEPQIKKILNSQAKVVDMIGKLDLIFNPDIQMWGTSAYEIDIKKCYLVERDKDGKIVLDSKGQEKKSLLYNQDSNKTAIVWDENAACFRFYAVYAPGD